MKKEGPNYEPLSNLLRGFEREPTPEVFDLLMEDYLPLPSGYFEYCDGRFNIEIDIEEIALEGLQSVSFFARRFEELVWEYHAFRRIYAHRSDTELPEGVLWYGLRIQGICSQLLIKEINMKSGET